MANIITQLDEAVCPVLANMNMGTWLQSIYTALGGGASASSTALASLQSGRALINSAKTKSVTVSTMVNSLKGKTVTIATLSNSMRAKFTTIATLANELRTDSTTNAAAVTSLKKWFLNQSYNKARLKIGATSSAAVQVAATVVNGTINGVFYSVAGAESAFATPTDSFAPAATRISRCFTFYYTSYATLTHSTGATISGTASAPVVPRVASNAFPLGVCKIILKAGTATRFNGGTTTLGAPGLTTTFIDYSCLPDYIGTYAPGVTAAALTSVAAAALTSIAAANVTSLASAAMSTPGDISLIGTISSLNIDESALSW